MNTYFPASMLNFKHAKHDHCIDKSIKVVVCLSQQCCYRWLVYVLSFIGKLSLIKAYTHTEAGGRDRLPDQGSSETGSGECSCIQAMFSKQYVSLAF